MSELLKIKAPDMSDYEENKHKIWSFPPDSPRGLTDMHYWYPRVKDLVETPETEEIKVPDDCNLVLLCDGEKPKHYDEFLQKLQDAVNYIGCPCFLRTGYTSNKHFWLDSCFLRSRDTEIIHKHVFNLTEFSAMIDQPLTYFYVRRFITTPDIFRTDYGMPVTQEFRLKLQDDEVTKIQPYWPEKAIEDVKEVFTAKDRSKLNKISQINRTEYNYLVNQTLKIRKGIPEGDWSVDWLRDCLGYWWMIDMARAEVSYWWEPDFQVVIDE